MYIYHPCGSADEESACNAGDLVSIPGLGRSPGKGKGYPLQYSGLENSMDCIVHGVSRESNMTERPSLSHHIFIQSCADGHLGYQHILAVISNAALDVTV